ncbi:MAG: cytochrome c oxidase subunit II [Chromatiales bacterium]|nr:cytochrome c oxidase subunit II [Chromatiales bacterium]
MRLIILALLSAGLYSPLFVAADWQVNLDQGATEISQAMYSLHMLIFYICVAIAVVVFGVMFWSIIRHRKSRGAEAHNFHESTTIEVAWSVVPFLILVIMAVPATKTLIAMYDPSDAELNIQITGSQWKWRYQYLEHDIDFISNLSTSQEQIDNKVKKSVNYLLEVDQPLVIPVNRKVRFLFTSNDVIHSWWVPALAVKQDAIPGFINEAWTKVSTPGTYRGQCTELCGVGHAFMPIVVSARPEAEFLQWVEEQSAQKQAEAVLAEKEWTLDELTAHGEQVYLKVCSVCHQPTGEGVPGAFPALKGSALMTGDINAHIDIVLNGRTGTAMQAFRDQLSAVDLAAVITYERNAWGNNSGDKVAPSQIQQQKQ